VAVASELPAAAGADPSLHRIGFEATNREDHEAGLMLYHPEVESTFPAGPVTVGTESGTRGREERLRFQAEWWAEWGAWRVEPEELIDLGDRVLTLGRIKGSGVRSGAPVDIECGFLFTVSAGRVIREQVFFSQEEALEAAGLSE
jgi:ketosteroid isomerase-like protein